MFLPFLSLSSSSKEIRSPSRNPNRNTHAPTRACTHTHPLVFTFSLVFFLLSTNYIPCLRIITSHLLSTHFSFSTPFLRTLSHTKDSYFPCSIYGNILSWILFLCPLSEFSFQLSVCMKITSNDQTCRTMLLYK